MAVVELFPQEWIKTYDTKDLCPNNSLIDSGNPNYWQHEVDGCSIYFVSKHKDEYGFYSVVYCTIHEELYQRLLDEENRRLPFGMPKHMNLDPQTIFSFDDRLLNGNTPKYAL